MYACKNSCLTLYLILLCCCSSLITSEHTCPDFNHGKDFRFLRYRCTSVITGIILEIANDLDVREGRTFLLSAGMLRRTKYSCLRNDSLASLEDRPQSILTLRRDLCMDSDFALLDPGTPDHHEGSRLSSFIPSMGSTAPQSGPRGQTTRDQTARGDHKETDWDWRSSPRLCNPPCSTEPLSGGLSALSGTKRSITLHRMTSLPSKFGCPCSQHRDGLCSLKTAAGDRTTVQTASGPVHHNIKVRVTT